MRTIVIAGVRPYDGRYEFDATRPFTAREWGWIKRLSGYLPPIDENMIRDPEFSVVIALIALHRAGKVATGDVAQLFERFSDAPDLELDVEVEPELEELEPPDPTSPPSSNGKAGSSGGDTSTSSASPAQRVPSSLGSPSSGISEFDPATSET